MLKFLNKVDHEKGFILRLLDSFRHKKRNYCLVFERLEDNLYDLLLQEKHESDNKKVPKGFSLEFTKMIGWQLLAALCLMSVPNINVIHSDIKPENIMLREKGKVGVKLIDFGNACFANKKMFKYVQSRYYRSPEVIM